MASEKQDGPKNNTLHMQSEIFSHEGELIWSVKEFSKFWDKTLISNEFSIVPCCQILWAVKITIGITVDGTCISIVRKDKERVDVPCEIQCSLGNSEGDMYRIYSLNTSFATFKKEGKCQEEEFIDDDEDCALDWDFEIDSLHDDLLIVKLRLKLKDCCMKTETGKQEIQSTFPKYKLSTDFLRGLQMLLDEKPMTDIVLNVGGVSVATHKAILCARSPVFRSMLESDMKEIKNGVIEITDIQPEIMEKFVSYLYTDIIGDVSIDVIRQLYTLAERYEVRSLQDKCGSALLENINDETVCKTLKLAGLHNNDILKEAASMYVAGNYSSLKHTAEFKDLVESDPRLVLHILMRKCLD